MKRCLILLLFLPLLASGQKVGLVLSGGAAKGIAHVGVLKALEENDIPIDYIVGTSMGGIIGGCYAAGMSPDQIESMVLSESFLRWISGAPEQGYNYRYHQNEASPGFLKVDLALDSTLNFQFNSTLANDASLNFILADKMAQASAISKGNFDSLFIPLRVIAAEIFTQNEITLSQGSLSDALRATQTVPFFYNPIRVDGRYLFDGGVYNNFPVDVVQREFKPDVIIGCNVSSKVFEEYPYKDDDVLISRSLLFLLLDKSDPSQIPKTGVYIQPDLRGYSSFDFSKAKSLIDSGYIQTKRQIEEIKNKIQARQTCDEVTQKRNSFNDRNIPFLFGDVKFKGFNSKQRGYIRRSFRTRKNSNEPRSFASIKKGYYNLVSESYFNNVYPGIKYDTSSGLFNLHLSRRPQKNFQVDFGGVIATRDISNIYLGLNYYHFGSTLLHSYGAFQTGNFYKSGLLKVRFDFPAPVYVEPYFLYQNWDYLASDDLLKEVNAPSKSTVLRRLSRSLGFSTGIPVREFFKCTMDFQGFNNVDHYINGNVFVNTDTLDVLRVRGFKTGLSFSANTLNQKQYPTGGKKYEVRVEYFSVREEHNPGNSSVQEVEAVAHHQWFRAKLHAEHYFGKGRFKSGYLVQAVFSNQPVFRNYFGTIINTPGYMPFQDSPTLILQNFRSFNFIGGGLRNIFSLTSKLDFRFEGHLFKPFDYLQQNSQQEAVISNELKSLFLAATAGFVYRAPIGPVSLSVNYYDDDENQLGVLLHIGFLLYNDHPVE
ncbi:MAG TPA: patatin-like phospholipase family protein [Ohtaekwangia sp.]